MPIHLQPGLAAPAVAARLAAWRAADVAARLLAHDAALWTDAGIADTPGDPIAERLGWVDLPFTSPASLPAWQRLADQARADGIRHIVLLGMGGSSLGAEVLARSLPRAAGAPELVVCDSTHPAFVRAVDAVVDPSRALVVAASKSGTTVETTAHFAHWWARLRADGPDPAAHCIAITDAGSPLAALAAERGFRACVVAPGDVGGRFSVLGPFGLLPAMLAGVDVAPVLDGAGAARAALAAAARRAEGDLVAQDDEVGSSASAERTSGLALGAALGAWAAAGLDTLVIDAGPPFEAMTGWLEQLLGESLGKHGRGLFPARPWGGKAGRRLARVTIEVRATHTGGAAGEEPAAPGILVRIGSPEDLGAALFAWEVATATAALAMGVQPFDQPDVEAAKRFARAAAAAGQGSPRPEGPAEAEELRATDIADVLRIARPWLAAIPPDGAIAVQAFLPPTAANDAALDGLARALDEATGAAVAWGYGPRYLHSTGQLHKGGPARIHCLQLVDGDPGQTSDGDVPIPDAGISFGLLIAAQAAGDAAALAALGRPPLVVRVGGA